MGDLMAKNLYVTNFIFPHKCYTEYSWAYSSKQAYFTCAKRVARKQDIPVSVVLDYFKKNKDKVNTAIEIEMED